MQERIIGALLIALVTAGTARGDEPSVYRVKSFKCKGSPETRTQTGFRIHGTKGIVTALHGVVGCGRIVVDDNSGQIEKPLYVRMVDVQADAALLSSDEVEALPADGFKVAKVKDWDALGPIKVIGHPFGINNQRTDLTPGVPARKRLFEILPDKLKLVLRERNSPSTELSIFNLQHLDIYPGHSGAPILDQKDQVLAMADGGVPGEVVGLHGGVVGIAWAIPMERVSWESAESNSKELVRLAEANAKGLFAFEESVPTVARNAPVTTVIRSVVEDLTEVLLDTLPCSMLAVGAAVSSEGCGDNVQGAFCSVKDVLAKLLGKQLGDLPPGVLLIGCKDTEAYINRGLPNGSMISLHCDLKGDWAGRHGGELMGNLLFGTSSKFALIRELLWIYNTPNERLALVNRLFELSRRFQSLHMIQEKWKSAKESMGPDAGKGESLLAADWDQFRVIMFHELLGFFSDPNADVLPSSNACEDCMCPNQNETKWLLREKCGSEAASSSSTCMVMTFGPVKPGRNRLAAIKFASYLVPLANDEKAPTQKPIAENGSIALQPPPGPVLRSALVPLFRGDGARFFPSRRNGILGLKVDAIRPVSTAAQLDIQNGDFIFKINGTALHDQQTALAIVNDASCGDFLTISVERLGQTLELKTRLVGERPASCQ